MVHCACKRGCNSNTCGCKKAGFKCSELCKVCTGSSCTNIEQLPLIDANDEEQESDLENIEEDPTANTSKLSDNLSDFSETSNDVDSDDDSIPAVRLSSPNDED